MVSDVVIGAFLTINEHGIEPKLKISIDASLINSCASCNLGLMWVLPYLLFIK